MRRLTLPERPDWRDTAQRMGFTFHTAEGAPYWDETAAFGFTLREIEEEIEAPSAELEEMCLAFVAEAIVSEEILTSLGIPRDFWGAIHESWQQGNRNLYGRFDFAYAGKGPAKLLEYNADTPTALFETGVFQWVWLEEQIARGVLPAGSDQFNSVHERLVEAFRNLRGGSAYRLHLACARGSAEDRGTVAYLEDCAKAAGLSTQFLFMDEIGVARDGTFVDLADGAIDVLFKLYPWEWMFREEFGQSVIGSRTQFIEPIWKAVLSNKGLMPHLWRIFPGHPNLLPAYFGGREGDDLGASYVEKPIHSREGANIRIIREGAPVTRTSGPYIGPIMRQKLVEIPDFGGGHVVIGAWMVASQPAGMLIREDESPITGNLARFVPHVIEA
ncbi:MAG: glutathionylspermidine synthase family protein [Methylobacterium sp.]|nr:glutathionylspermidine synthase family protein [Methylobacterium sp.]MCA3606892.1 glutathionylspermidine synthase family protein [Methylobacterium sp.]MCA3609400.1 glutathionylspermidine synthase family protein [Methylobacterium sp.]MCA3619304.1 glutathionylspermidine synthase family protein [Methylobacterium sp.]MCA3622276.1 glutathionylspermidine synthase family protein [Methylobacterium sp.]